MSFPEVVTEFLASHLGNAILIPRRAVEGSDRVPFGDDNHIIGADELRGQDILGSFNKIHLNSVKLVSKGIQASPYDFHGVPHVTGNKKNLHHSSFQIDGPGTVRAVL